MNKELIIVRGAGDLASGIIWYLKKANFNVLALEIKNPSCIRREVSFSEAIYDGEKTIENETAIFCKNLDEVYDAFKENKIAIMIDEVGNIIKELKPKIVVDAIMAKKNLGTSIDMAPLVIAIGPGFTAKYDCHYVIETKRGHKLGKIYDYGSAIPNTGIPGLVVGHDKDRVMHSPAEGYFLVKKNIGDIVKKDEVIAVVKECTKDNDANNDFNIKETGREVELKASIDGVLRGILRNNFYATSGLKAADIDPRIEEKENCKTISDKARTIAGSVLLCVNNFLNV